MIHHYFTESFLYLHNAVSGRRFCPGFQRQQSGGGKEGDVRKDQVRRPLWRTGVSRGDGGGQRDGASGHYYGRIIISAINKHYKISYKIFYPKFVPKIS